MPRVTDRTAIRSLLETDRRWAVYALGDLAPGFFEHSEWFATAGAAPGLVLLYRAFDTPVLFTLGDTGAVVALLEGIGELPAVYLSVPPEVCAWIRERYEVRHEEAMWRMVLEPREFAGDVGGSVRLGPADLSALQALYADGEEADEAPHFFTPAMLEEGVFYGVREGEELIAAAGTHLVAEGEGVAAIGSVYTRRDRRGRGLAGHTTSGVTAELLRRGIRTVALNVAQRNEPAGRVYGRLGFTRYCPFYEGLAVKAGEGTLPQAPLRLPHQR